MASLYGLTLGILFFASRRRTSRSRTSSSARWRCRRSSCWRSPRPGGERAGAQPPGGRARSRSRRAGACSSSPRAGLAALLIWGLTGLPDFGTSRRSTGSCINHVAVAAAQHHRRRHRGQLRLPRLRHAGRGVHPLRRRARPGPAAPRDPGRAAGTARRRRPERRPPHDQRGAPPADRRCLVPFTVLLAIYITAHGHLTPGGGFQGGVIAATALLLVYLGGEYVALRRRAPADAGRGRQGGGRRRHSS